MIRRVYSDFIERMKRSMIAMLPCSPPRGLGKILGAGARQRLEPDPLRVPVFFLGTFFFLVFGRHFPKLPLKILPRADFVSPLPI